MNDERLKDDVLYAFAVEPQHDQVTLDHYLRLHPEFKEDLIDLSFELRLCAATQDPVTAAVDAKSKIAWHEFVACAPASTKTEKEGNLFPRGEAFVELANALGMPRSLLTALRDRLTEPTSIPNRTVERLANSLAASVETVRNYLMQPPGIVATAQFKSDKKPSQQARVTFKELVESTEMSDGQRKAILQDWDDDRPSRG